MKSTQKTLPNSSPEWANLLAEKAAVIAEKSDVIEKKTRVIAERTFRTALTGNHLIDFPTQTQGSA